jgi:zinc protease
VRYLHHVAKGAIVASVLLLSPGALAQSPGREAPKQGEWKPETFELANGMKAVVLPDHRAPVVTHMLWYRVGSADEEKGKSGLAHFLEHLMFKATDEIPAGEYSKIVARNGGQDNAATFFDYTNYHFRVAKDRLPLMMRMEADRMTGLKLEEAEVLPERDVVKEERRQNVESNPGAVLEEKVYAALYAGHPYSVPVIGYMGEVAKLSRDDAWTWYKTWYGPENAILVVAGDVTAAELEPLAQDIYGKIPRRGDLKVRAWPAVKPLAKSLEVSHSDPRVRQPSWSRNWLGVAIGDDDAEALHVAMEILGGGRTSRLYRELVEKGVAVSSYAYSMEMEAPGTVSVSASPAPGVTLDGVKTAVLAVTDAFLKEGPTAEELKRAKKMIAASEIYAHDSQSGMAEWYGSMLTAGMTVEEIEGWDDRIQAVTAEQVRAAANKYLSGVNHIDARLLPVAQ